MTNFNSQRLQGPINMSRFQFEHFECIKQPTKKCLQVYKTPICSPERHMKTEITSFYILNVCSVHVYYRSEVEKSPFSHRDTLNRFNFTKKILRPVKVLQPRAALWKAVAAGHACSLSGWVWLGKKKLLDRGHGDIFRAQKQRQRCWTYSKENTSMSARVQLGTVQNGVWTYWSVCRISRLIRAMAACDIRFKLGEGATTACYKTIIDGFPSERAINMINRAINRSIWA